MRTIAIVLAIALATAACDEGRTSSGGGAGSSVGGAGAGAGAQGGDDECAGMACGAPCYACADPPCSQQICDDNETCQAALDVTCMQ